MNIPKLLKIIKNDTWWSEECPGNYIYTISAWRAFILQAKLYKKHLQTTFASYVNGFSYERTPERQKLAQFYFALKLFKTNHKVLNSHFKKFRKLHSKLKRDGQYFLRYGQTMTNQQIAFALEVIFGGYVNCFVYSVMSESADIYTQYHYINDLKKATKIKFDNGKLMSFAIILSSEPRLSFMEQERLEFLSFILKGKQNFTGFAKKYFWMQNNYAGAKFLSKEYFKKEANKLRRLKSRRALMDEYISLRTKPKRQRQELNRALQELHLPHEFEELTAFLRFISLWIDERKSMALKAVGYLGAICSEIVKRFTIPLELVKFYTPEELTGLLHKNQVVPLKILQQRQKMSVIFYKKTKLGYLEQIILGKPAQRLHNLLTGSRQNKIIRGLVASAPVKKLSGIVQIILNTHTEKFISGRILVTTMTRPDFVPLMRKARAIICDEGGITSHAAIISREMGIPCIIGTKMASKILNNGNKIELDLISGIIKFC